MKTFFFLSGLWLLLTTSSSADFFVTQNRAEFLTKIGEDSYTEGFEEFVLGQSFLEPMTFTDSNAKYQYTVSPIGGEPVGGLFSLGLQNDKWLSTQLERSVRFDFGNTRPTALGGDFFFTNAVGTESNQLGSTMLLTLNGTTQFTMPANLTSSNSFLGIYGNVAINSLVLSRNSNPSNSVSYITVNNFTVGITAVPEPSTIALLFVAAITLISNRRFLVRSMR